MQKFSGLVFMAFIFLFISCKSNKEMDYDAGLSAFSADSLKAHIAVLASDSFMGRKPFTEGETRTISYLQQEFKAVGLEAGNGDSYLQEVPMVNITTKAAPTMEVTSPKGNFTLQGFDDYAI